MDNTISFTLSELFGLITTIGGCIVAVETVAIIIFKLVARVKAPELKQNARLDALEKADEEKAKEICELRKEMQAELKKRDDRLNSGDDKFEKVEEGNKIILRGLQALLNQSLGIKDAEALKKVSEDLSEFLLNK